MSLRFASGFGFLLILGLALLGAPSDGAPQGRPAAGAQSVVAPAPMLLNRLPGDREILFRRGTIVDAVYPEWIRVYVRPDEVEALRAEGFQPLPLEEQDRIGIDVHEPVDGPYTPLLAYPSLATLAGELAALAEAHPDRCRLESAGRSFQGREIWVLVLGRAIHLGQPRPRLRLISTMHGDEPVGTVLLLELARHLLDRDGLDPAVTALLDGAEIHLLPLMNPDGYVLNWRVNAQGHDLNRAFPDRLTDPVDLPAGRPTEVGVVMGHWADRPVSLGANLHTGTVVVNYPWDHDLPGIPSGSYAACPDDDIYQAIARVYADRNPAMAGSQVFPHGVTNGSDWYAVTGGLQDWAYALRGSLEVTVELSQTKRPSASTLPGLWGANREALLAYLGQGLQGLAGTVRDADSGWPVAAYLAVAGRETVPYPADPRLGHFQRSVRPGVYTLLAVADGYQPAVVGGVGVTAEEPAWVDIRLVSAAAPGDVDGDGAVTGADAAALADTLAAVRPGWRIHRRAADRDGDGRLTSLDLLRVRLQLAGHASGW